jgi:hypothetical protein
MAAHVNERAAQAYREYVRLTGVKDSVYSQATMPATCILSRAPIPKLVATKRPRRLQTNWHNMCSPRIRICPAW